MRTSTPSFTTSCTGPASWRRLDADHSYGAGCYGPGGCADIIEPGRRASIDARQFNPAFPATFPRFVQQRDLAVLQPRAASMSATAIGSTTPLRCDNRCIASCFAAVIASLCALHVRKSLYFNDFSALLTTTIGCNISETAAQSSDASCARTLRPKSAWLHRSSPPVPAEP